MEFADYRYRAIRDLCSYMQLKSRHEILTRQVNMLTGIVSMPLDEIKVSNTFTDATDAAFRLEELKKELNLLNFRIICIESGLNALADSDKEILTSFYITRQRNTVNNLARKNYTDRSCIYRRAQKALKKYIYACYGVTEI